MITISLENGDSITIEDKRTDSEEGLDTSEEAFPRLGQISPGPHLIRSERYMSSKRVYSSLDACINGADFKNLIQDIKTYCENKGWIIGGEGDISKVPTLWTDWFKQFGSRRIKDFEDARKSIVPKKIDGVEVLFVKTTDLGDSKLDTVRKNDTYIGHVILMKKEGDGTFFQKQITPTIIVSTASQNEKTL